MVQFIRRFYQENLIVASLGESQDTPLKRIKSFKKGYMKGQPDLLIQNIPKYYNGMCIEFKTHKYDGEISEHQKEMIDRYEDNGYKCIVSNDYDLIIKEINDYMQDIRIKCKYCKRKFKSKETLKRHQKFIHRNK